MSRPLPSMTFFPKKKATLWNHRTHTLLFLPLDGGHHNQQDHANDQSR